MGKRRSTNTVPNTQSRSQNLISLREEVTGKKQMKGEARATRSTNMKAILRHEHSQNLAVWAGQDASMPSLAAFFGQRLAADGEAAGIVPDPSLFSCQRCETILQPGFNCTIRIEKNSVKAQRSSKKLDSLLTQNNVVYKCHFCSYKNLKRGTQKGHMKEIYPVKPTLIQKLQLSNPAKSILHSCVFNTKEGTTKCQDEIQKVDGITNSPVTPMVRPAATLLDRNKRKRNKSRTPKPSEFENKSAIADLDKTLSASSKRRKSWTTLKEIVESNERDTNRQITNLKIPFGL
ncbi:uncharacterized protein LOC110815787 [Carica papaya]|uniref:uncharacterized protein LOC110815787 n=1 Tax=Carica papaya TaxID=3649 RepID=UPI000B8CAD6D|nr:uncharacterized protein LOC110815787 [Carica papaya]XP_021899418.1 uncharacterized protein LOC110815787 [Carica papaya]XP_021899419.1 uncharacterized protein LOC110815787 [Carica papaya]